MSTSRLALAMLLGLALAGCAPSRARTAVPSPPPAYPQEPGPYQVGAAEGLVLHDAARRRDVPFKVFYPTQASAVPVIIFAHGAQGSRDSFPDLTRYWVSHGYVCIHPTLIPAAPGPRDWQGWLDRTQDLRLMLDSLSDLPRLAPPLAGKLDVHRVGLAGHSAGAFSAQLIDGALVGAPPWMEWPTLNDPRVAAFLFLSGWGRGVMGLSDGSFKSMTRPMMCMTGSLDVDPDKKQDPFNLSPPGDKYNVFIEGAEHGSFSGRAEHLSAAQEAAIFGWVKSGSRAFWDTYLKQDAAARSWLQSPALSQQSRGRVKLSHR